MDKILFSIPVHERPDLVREQIENINYFCPGSLIYIHIAEDTTESRDDFARQCRFDNVVINPKSYPVVPSSGYLHTHVSNFLLAINQGVEFDKILLMTAEELLVKHGLAEHVSKYPAGVQTEVFDLAAEWGVFREDFLKAEPIQNFLKSLELPLYFGGQAEGQFLSKKIFSQLTRVYAQNFPMGPCGFPIEEVFPPTVAARHCLTGLDLALPITLCDYCTRLKITEEILEQVISGKGSLYADRMPMALRSPHMGVSVLKSVFSVKIGPRVKWDIRGHIRGLMT
jgi:hypothetical protein